jgi:phosphoglycolate phosphatase
VIRIQAALLDLDGTLLDSIPDLADAANAMRIELGMSPLGLDVLTTFVGKGIDNLVRRTLSGSLLGAAPDDALFERALASFRRHYAMVNGDKAKVFEGVIPGLLAMREQGLALAVVTNKPTEFTGPLLTRAGLAGFFPVVVCGDTCARRKPDPDQVLYACEKLDVPPEMAVTIGDSVNDAQAGRSAGTRVLVVPYGYNEGRDVHTLDADAIVPRLTDAARVIAHWNTTP